jgi:hypothetical protein
MVGRKNRAHPAWFPLPVYQRTLTKNEWLAEIAIRAGLQTAHRNRREGKIHKLQTHSSSEQAFLSIIVEKESRARIDLAQAQERNFWPVRDLTAFELSFLAEQRISENDESRAWARRLSQEGSIAVAEFFSSGAHERVLKAERSQEALADADAYMNVLGKRVAVMIDLDHDDSTLELAFKVWLAGARDALKEKAAHPVGDKEIAKWKKYGLLPAFDLLLWSDVTNSGYTDAFIARLLWPDNGEEFVDLTERFRKVTRPMLREFFDWNFVERFWRQMELENTLDVIVAREKLGSTGKAP